MAFGCCNFNHCQFLPFNAGVNVDFNTNILLYCDHHERAVLMIWYKLYSTRKFWGRSGAGNHMISITQKMDS